MLIVSHRRAHTVRTSSGTISWLWLYLPQSVGDALKQCSQHTFAIDATHRMLLSVHA
jgi:hypothetical protein